MKIGEKILSTINYSEEDSSFYPQELLDLFEIYDSIDYDRLELKKFWYHKWMCTDTYVGISVYTLDDKVVAISFKPYRKYDEVFYFKNQMSAKRIKKHLLSICPQAQDNSTYETFTDLNSQNIINLAEEIGHKKFESKHTL